MFNPKKNLQNQAQSNNVRIKVKSLEFHGLKFRKLQNIKIDFADRLTVIAGHNGIGKSTILGLVANTFGITESPYKSFFGEPFYANIERIVYLALKEVDAAKLDPAAAPIVIAEVGNLIVKKRCSMTQRKSYRRARVVPRTVDKAPEDSIGQDAKVPLPTIYLGMKRLASIGEADEKEVSSTVPLMEAEDRKLIADFVKRVIVGVEVTTDVTHQSIKGSKKKTVQPGYGSHEALAVSMGQDSLGSIATALASFNHLKRELGQSYPGGLLVIDELDIGFHPHAIVRLVAALKLYAKRLDLQIVATTHSPKLIEAVHPDGGGDKNAPDSVVYLIDTKFPRLAPDQSLKAILDEMALSQTNSAPAKPTKPVLCVYFEDDEGKQFCDAILSSAERKSIGAAKGVSLNFIALGLGGTNLLNLPSKDPLFKLRVLVVDADTTIREPIAKLRNSVKLPCTNGAGGTNRSPENTIKNFLRLVASSESGPLRGALFRFNIPNPTSNKIEETFFSDDSSMSQKRESSKNWWKLHWPKLKAWGVLREWAACHEDEVKAFRDAFEKAVEATANRLKNSGLA